MDIIAGAYFSYFFALPFCCVDGALMPKIRQNGAKRTSRSTLESEKKPIRRFSMSDTRYSEFVVFTVPVRSGGRLFPSVFPEVRVINAS